MALTPANAEVGSQLYRIMRALEHLDLSSLMEVEIFIHHSQRSKRAMEAQNEDRREARDVPHP